MSAHREGFWRLAHDDLEAILHRTDLSWESARVFLAVADLTRGYGKECDALSLGQVEAATGIHRRHVSRALVKLAALGLYGQEGAGETVIRWVAFPAGVPDAGNTVPVPDGVPSGVPGGGGGGVPKGVPGAGALQDSKKIKTTKTTKKSARRQGPATPADPWIKVFIDWFSEEYQRRTGRKYIVVEGKDGAIVKRLLGQFGQDGQDPVVELKRATGTMFADDWAKDKAGIGLLGAQINKWLGPPATSAPRGSRGRHTPAPATGDDFGDAVMHFDTPAMKENP